MLHEFVHAENSEFDSNNVNDEGLIGMLLEGRKNCVSMICDGFESLLMTLEDNNDIQILKVNKS